MKRCLVKLSLISSCALLATHAPAQSSADAAKPAPKTLTAAASVKAALPASATIITAAGSVIVLADGMVANARMALVQPPAAGFVYER